MSFQKKNNSINAIYSLFYKINTFTIFFNATNNLIEMCTSSVYNMCVRKISSAHTTCFIALFLLMFSKYKLFTNNILPSILIQC